MLLGYAVENYRSFKEEAYLDLRPAKTKVLSRYPDNFVVLGTGEKVLKEVVIVGENAGGKSNFVESMRFLRDLLTRTDLQPRSYANTVNSSNVFFSDKEQTLADPALSRPEQSFYIEVALERLTYTYQLTLGRRGIERESLSYRSSRGGKEHDVFVLKRTNERSCRSCDEAEACDHRGFAGCSEYELEYHSGGTWSSGDMERFNDAQGDGRRLTLVWMATVGDIHCKRLLEWLVDRLVVVRAPSPAVLEGSLSAEELLGAMTTEEYLDIVRLIDPSIKEIQIDAEHPLRESSIIRVNEGGQEFRRPVKDDSAGVRLFLCWAYYIYLVIYQNKTVVADEIDSAINPVLSDWVIALVNGSKHWGQFIFATHNIFNLMLRTHMKEQIYFITKDPATLESSLYSAADFDEIRYDVKGELYEFYLRGLFGGTVHA